MLSEEYTKKFTETLERIKTASPANKFIGFLRPFGNQKKYDTFAKAMMKQNPWMAKAGVNPANALQSLEDYRPLRAIVQRFGKLNAKNAQKQGDIYKKDFARMYPEQFAKAEKKVRNSNMLQGAGLGAAGTTAGVMALQSKSSKQDPYAY